MKKKLFVLAAVAMFTLVAFGVTGHAFAQGPTGTPSTSSTVTQTQGADHELTSAVDTDTVQDASGVQGQDGTPDSAAVKSVAPDTDNIQSGAQDGQQIEDGLPETSTPESGG